MNFKIIENILDPQDTNYITNIILSSDFPWYFNKNSANKFENILIKLLQKFNIKGKLLRARFGLHTSNKIKKIDDKHIDSLLDHDVILYYLNDSDGDTYFYNKNKIIKQITPQFNKAIFFDGNIYHSSSKPVKSDRRVVLNLNVTKQ